MDRVTQYIEKFSHLTLLKICCFIFLYSVFRDRHLHRIGLIVFCIALTLIFVGTIVCCFWLKKADASRQIRARKAAEARARAQRMIGAPNPVNEALLTVPQVWIYTWVGAGKDWGGDRARAQRMIGAPNPVNEALLTVPQV